MSRSSLAFGVARAALATALPVALALSLAACGGGGGDDSPTPPPGDVNVTAANQDALSHAVLVAMQGGLGGGELGVSRGGQVLGAFAQGARRLASAPNSRRERSASIRGPVVEACFVSGNTSTTLDDRDESGAATVGDTITVVYNACDDGNFDVTNGTLAATLDEIVASPFSFNASATYSNYAVASTATARSATYNGTFTMAYAELSASTATLQIKVTSPLTVGVVHPLYSDTLTLQTDFWERSTFDMSTPPGATSGGSTRTEAGGHVTSSTAGGTVFAWTQPPHVEWWAVDPHPRAGQVLVQGARGKLLLTILSAATVRLELDADDDGVYEATKDVPWDSLL